MSLSMTYRVQCDRCGTLSPTEDTSKHARQRARAHGFKRRRWLRPDSRYGYKGLGDLCPRCHEEVPLLTD